MLVLKNSTENFAKREAGGKGYNLYLMTKQGLPVPVWATLGRSQFEDFVEQAQLATPLREILKDYASGMADARQTANAVEALFFPQPLPPSIQNDVHNAWNLVSEGEEGVRISVRSSAIDEDGSAHSFAGQLSSYLYVETEADAASFLKACWASGFSERCLVYRKQNGLDLFNISVAVVFQKMLDPSVSGVLFTCDPLKNDLSQHVVSSVYGVGEGLVSGALEADTFWLSAKTGALLRSDVVEKSHAFRQEVSGHCRKLPIDSALQKKSSLNAVQLAQLHGMGRALQQFYGIPQDVEWAIVGEKCYLLQTRPVTALEKNLTGFPNLWDNSNIVESYGGLTSPLSFTFALNNYRNVYVQFCELIGVPRGVVKEMDSYLRNMLGIFNGRVFYNLYNWYKLVGVLPGFKNNRQFMETMMGVGEELSSEMQERLRPHPSWDTWRGKLRKIRTGFTFLYYHFTIQSVVNRFLRDFKTEYDKFRKYDYERMTSDQIFEKYLEMDRVMLGKWKAPIINDFLCMIHFGILKKLTEKWLQKLGPGIQNDLLAGQGQIESAEPTKTLIHMAGDVVKNPPLHALILETPAQHLFEVLHQSSHTEFYARVCSYIDRFGFRCMSEMKLEEKDLLADPSFLFSCLKNYVRSGTTDLHTYELREKALRERAEGSLKGALTGMKKHIYQWSLTNARHAVRNRENTRFARTRSYGVGRSMFRAMGKDLAGRGILNHGEDIFYLTLEEIYGIHQGTLPTTNLSDFAALRRKSYGEFKDLEPKIRFQTRGPVYWQNPYLAEAELPDVEENADYDLKGLPCCPGIVEGIVKIIQDPGDDLNLNGEILVTARTDPGWVPLYPSISGLLVERGSLLSHSAIVAREMGLPTVVGIRALMSTLSTGMRIRIDGARGTIQILKRP